MKKSFRDRTPSISLTLLATLGFVTLVLCQTRFKIAKEMSRESYPPVLKSKDCWFLYTIGNPDRFKCVLKAFIVISSPVLSLISTGLLLFGKIESNPYFFIPWLFLTIKGLVLIQSDNLITILRDMATRTNYAFGFRIEDVKWLLFYLTIFMIDLVEAFSFCEIFDLFLALWNHHPGYNTESVNLEVVKKEVAEIVGSLSRCSLGSLSKISLGSLTESEEDNESDHRNVKNNKDRKELKQFKSLRELKEMAGVKFSLPEKEKVTGEKKRAESFSRGDHPAKHEFAKNLPKKVGNKYTKSKDVISPINANLSEGDIGFRSKNAEILSKVNGKDVHSINKRNSGENIYKVKVKGSEEEVKNVVKSVSSESYATDLNKNKQVSYKDAFRS